MPMHERSFKQSNLNFTHCISLRHFGPYEDVNDTWARLSQLAAQLGVTGPDVVAFGICYDDPTRGSPDRFRYDACLAISRETYDDLRQRLGSADAANTPGQQDLRVEEFKLGRTMMTVHRGDHRNLRDAYTDVMRASAFRGLGASQPRPPFVEVYRNHPATTAGANLITEIHIPGLG